MTSSVVPRALCALLVATSACGEDTPQAALEVELALSPMTASCDVSTETLTSILGGCLEIEVCVREPGGAVCEPIRVTASRDFTVEPGSVFLPIQLDRQFAFAAELGVGEKVLELRAVAYDATGTPVAEGRRVGVARSVFEGDTPVRLRLYRYGRASCAGGQVGRESGTGVECALHTATRLPNGDVLLYGGVRDRAAATQGEMDWSGAPLQRQVEIYHADQERFEVLEGELPRVMFASTLLTQDPNATSFDIYIAGGFTVTGPGAVIRLDDVLRFSQYGAPVLPADGVSVAEDVILRYTPAERSVVLLPAASVTTTSLPPAGASITDDAPLADSIPVLLGASMPRQAAPWDFIDGVYWLHAATGANQSTTPAASNAHRYGATITWLGSGNAFIWGGNVAETMMAQVLASAGQVVTPAGAASSVAAGGATGLPEPVVFHSATLLGDSEVLVAGGLRVGCPNALDPTCFGGERGITTFYAPSPLTVFQTSGTTVTSARTVGPGAYRVSILHDAIRLPDGTALVTGGAVNAERQLLPVDQVVRVTSTEVTSATPGFDGGLRIRRWGHQVTRLDVCPATATDCADPRYLVTGGFIEEGGGATRRFKALGDAEVLYLRDTTDQPRVTFEAGTCNATSRGMTPDGGSAPTDSGAMMSLDAGMGADSGVDGGM